MNYFAHGRDFVDNPYFLAGTCVPDWLGVVDRKVRARAVAAARFVDDVDPRLAAVARGIVQHHHDDRWFHQTQAFVELSLELTLALRDALDDRQGMRPSFLGHILVEILLDAELIAEQPEKLAAYYAALASLDIAAVGQAVNRIATRPTDELGPLVERFAQVRFLYDYADNGKLLMRLNQVMRRVRLAQLPAEMLLLLPAFRQKVRHRREELLTESEKGK